MNKEFKTAIKAARLAGKFVRSRVGKIRSIRYKGEINIVTDVDVKAERLIINTLKKEFKDYGFLAEESQPRKIDKNKWIIDPLDGTTNFAHEFPFFAVSIALEKQGKIVLGVVYDPMHDELFTAIKGRGAYLNQKRIKVSKVQKIKKAFLSTGFSYTFKGKKEDNLDNFEKFIRVSLALRRAGSATLDLCYVACGRFDGFWELDLFPWDTAAASLIVEEAGGRVSHFDGSTFSNYGTNILASNGLLHKKMLQVLKKK